MVFHSDVDEFMALMDPDSGNLADLELTGCLRGVTQALFWLDDTGHDSCGAHDELACFGVGAHQLAYMKS
jgi:hypothetical protein